MGKNYSEEAWGFLGKMGGTKDHDSPERKQREEQCLREHMALKDCKKLSMAGAEAEG